MTSTTPQLDRTYICPGDRICAAVSGGADSVALLLLLHAANGVPKNALGVGLSAVHVHHGLRGEEADGDLAFVRALCIRLEVPLHVHHANVQARVATSRQAGRAETLEEAARHLRYEVFGSLIADGHADSVLTAHTLDDQAETVLMKLLRGAWTDGLSGIHPVVAVIGGTRPGKILRPLLGVRRTELEDFLRGQDQPWCTDSSNLDEAFTRNRIRHHLLPLLREYNPSIESTLGNVAELARDEETHWQAELSRILPQILLPGKPVRGGGRAVSTAAGGPETTAIELERLRGFDNALRRRVLRAAARTLGIRLSFDETQRLVELVGEPQNPRPPGGKGGRLELSGGLRAERTARELRLERAK
jgi:tRNA(Ile)-lysidine synthase